MNKYVFILILSIFFTGCGNKVIFNESRPMNNNVWNRFEDQIFEVAVEEDTPYDIFLTLSHTNKSNSSVFVTISIETPGGEFRAREYQFKLKSRENEWLGNPEGDTYKIELPIKKDFVFKKKGNCKITVENRYSKVQLPGISAVGLLVQKSN